MMEEVSGGGGIRTPDLLNAIQTRSQLRHTPNVNASSGQTIDSGLFGKQPTPLEYSGSGEMSTTCCGAHPVFGTPGGGAAKPRWTGTAGGATIAGGLVPGRPAM